MTKPKWLISCLVYGNTYSTLFCNNQLKSLLDPTNLPAVADKYDIEFCIYTDHDTARTLTANPYLQRLAKTVKLSSNLFNWPKDEAHVKKFDRRYGLLTNVFHETVKKGLAENFDYVTAWVADLVVAQEFCPRILKRMDDGHGAVFVLPLRSAHEAVTPNLNKYHYALPDKDLCALGLECMHPLWVACNWNNPQFTKLPFTMLWSGMGGVLARTFSTTPIIFRPRKEMLERRGMIDGDIPELCDNPYWATDWTDAPVIGVEPLICYYPPFSNRPASVPWVSDWCGNLHPTQIPFIEKHCYYPSKAAVTMRPEVLQESDDVVAHILSNVGGTAGSESA